MYPLIVLCNCLGILLGNLLLFGTIVRPDKAEAPLGACMGVGAFVSRDLGGQ